jgi:hypothetical protein
MHDDAVLSGAHDDLWFSGWSPLLLTRTYFPVAQVVAGSNLLAEFRGALCTYDDAGDCFLDSTLRVQATSPTARCQASLCTTASYTPTSSAHAATVCVVGSQHEFPSTQPIQMGHSNGVILTC